MMEKTFRLIGYQDNIRDKASIEIVSEDVKFLQTVLTEWLRNSGSGFIELTR